jgi:hypothetical protein
MGIVGQVEFRFCALVAHSAALADFPIADIASAFEQA